MITKVTLNETELIAAVVASLDERPDGEESIELDAEKKTLTIVFDNSEH